MMWLRCLVAGLISILLLAGIPADAQMDEYSIKAGYLYNFSKYVSWPQGTFSAPTAPLVICVVGVDPFEGKLDQVIAGRTTADGRELQIKRVGSGDVQALTACQILFLSKSERRHATAIVETLKTASVLTVADFSPFAETGGIVNLRIDGTKVKVDLNMNAAIRANLKVSGRLQQVANLVNGSNQQNPP